MAIPKITPYPLPVEAETPANQAGWLANADRAVLLIHDMQRYFVDFFPSDAEPLTGLLRNIAVLKAAAVRYHVPVVYTAQPGGMSRAERGLLQDFWGPGMNSDPRHRQIVDPVQPAPGDTIVTRWRYSAFARTNLEEVIRQHRRDQLIICGVFAHVGCLATATDAFGRDIETFLVADGIADFTAADHQMAINYAARRCAMTPTTASVIEQLSSTTVLSGPSQLKDSAKIA